MKMGKIEELEKVLAEKVEKEEGWRELEIGNVKPVYIGKTIKWNQNTYTR